MSEELEKFAFEGQEVDFIPGANNNVMVNATQMAKIFGKEVTHFLQNESTIRFIKSCLNTKNSEFLNIKSESDLYFGKQKSGTFMHRILALKFAAWLNPDFEVWVYFTIEHILFGKYEKVDQIINDLAQTELDIEKKEAKLFETKEFKELEALKAQKKALINQRSKENKNQLDLFKEAKRQ